MNLFKKVLLTIKVIRNLHLFVLDFLGFLNNEEILYKLKNGLNFITRGGSTDAAEVIIVNGDLEYPKVYFKNLINSVILDVGANIGAFSLYSYNILVSQNPKIYSIEPSIENFGILQRNIIINNSANNIKAFNMALCGKDGKSFLNIGGDYDAFYVFDDRQHIDNKNTQEVEVIKLETFCNLNSISIIDLLKMDIEGGEYDVFYNSIDFIKNNIKYIFVEIHDISQMDNMGSFKKFILNNNFKIKSEILNRTLFLVNKKYE
ncbi:MAG: FkbM family methyltransferase [Patescibacteria group bacterium]